MTAQGTGLLPDSDSNRLAAIFYKAHESRRTSPTSPRHMSAQKRKQLRALYGRSRYVLEPIKKKGARAGERRIGPDGGRGRTTRCFYSES